MCWLQVAPRCWVLPSCCLVPKVEGISSVLASAWTKRLKHNHKGCSLQ